MKIRGKTIKKAYINIILEDFIYHAHNATFSRKAVRFGKPYVNYYSWDIKKMNDRESVHKRMKDKLKKIRENRYYSLRIR
jgi:hypothetical protein